MLNNTTLWFHQGDAGMASNSKSVRIWEEDYERLVRIQGFLQMRDGELMSIPELISEVLDKYITRGKLPDDLFGVTGVKK